MLAGGQELQPKSNSKLNVIVALTVSFALRLLAAWFSHGIAVVDVHTFLTWAQEFAIGRNPYSNADHAANYPPLWIVVCWVSLKVSEVTRLSFDLVIKGLIGLFDATTILAVRSAVRARGRSDTGADYAMWLYAINPVPILIASVHGQNDPVVMGLVLWAAWLLMAKPIRFSTEFGMLLAGLSLTVKPIAVLFIPILALASPSWRQRIVGVAISLIPSVLFWLPYLLTGPQHVVSALTSYGGVSDLGYVGIYNSWCNLGLSSPGVPVVSTNDISPAVRLVWLAFLFMAWWQRRRSDLIEQLAVLVLSIFVFYGLLAAQYLMWLIPFATVLLNRRLVSISAWTTVTLVAFYELHHPNIITGGEFHRLPGLTIPQWSGIFLFAQLFLYGHWLRWWWALVFPRVKCSIDGRRILRQARRASRVSGE